MTKEQIDTVLGRVRSWPKARQEDAVKILLAIEAMGTEPYRLSPEENADIDAALLECARGEFASDEDVEALFNRCHC